MRLPKTITIEIHTFCNHKCEYCPRLTNLEHRMDLVLFDYILAEYKKICDDFRFRGRMNFCNDSEPFYDDSIFLFLSEAMSFDFDIYINTNGIGLNEDRLKRLKGLGWDGDLNIHYIEGRTDFGLIKKYFPKAVELNKNNLAIQSRAGLLWDVKKRENVTRCDRPDNQMVIRWNGDVSYCCQDFHRKHIVGNIANGFWEIWEQLGNYPPTICKTCERAECKI